MDFVYIVRFYNGNKLERNIVCVLGECETVEAVD